MVGPRRIVLSGCSGGGKSTLLAGLARRGHAFAEFDALLAAFPANGYQVRMVPRLPVAARADWIEAELRMGGS